MARLTSAAAATHPSQVVVWCASPPSSTATPPGGSPAAGEADAVGACGLRIVRATAAGDRHLVDRRAGTLGADPDAAVGPDRDPLALPLPRQRERPHRVEVGQRVDRCLLQAAHHHVSAVAEQRCVGDVAAHPADPLEGVDATRLQSLRRAVDGPAAERLGDHVQAPGAVGEQRLRVVRPVGIGEPEAARLDIEVSPSDLDPVHGHLRAIAVVVTDVGDVHLVRSGGRERLDVGHLSVEVGEADRLAALRVEHEDPRGVPRVVHGRHHRTEVGQPAGLEDPVVAEVEHLVRTLVGSGRSGRGWRVRRPRRGARRPAPAGGSPAGLQVEQLGESRTQTPRGGEGVVLLAGLRLRLRAGANRTQRVCSAACACCPRTPPPRPGSRPAGGSRPAVRR